MGGRSVPPFTVGVTASLDGVCEELPIAAGESNRAW